MILRDYQIEAVDSVYLHLRERTDNPAVVLPTGSGKSIVLAQIIKDAVTLWGGRVLSLVHTKELIEQNAEKTRLLCPGIDIGVYSAGLKSRDTCQPVVFGGIQSIYKRACEFDPFDIIIIDEAHMVPEDGEGMYRRFLSDARIINPAVRIIGLTATPYRMKSGMICGPENILNHVCYEAGVRELIVKGYLCPLKTKAGKVKADTSGLHIRAGEFVAEEVETLMDTEHLVSSACSEIMNLTEERKSVLIFASGVRHAEHVAKVIRETHGRAAATVFGDTPYKERDETIARFKSGALKFLVNVNVLSVGFDAPNIDCVVLLRPTMSPGLFYQMTGRAFRLHPSKEYSLILDYGGNILRHGPVDDIKIRKRGSDEPGEAPAKECPECNLLIHAAYSKCPECGYMFPPPDRSSHDSKASTASVLSGEVTITDYEVKDVSYSVHFKKNLKDGDPLSMRVDYQIGWQHIVSEWVCFEHDGYARWKAEEWWKKRCELAVPSESLEAVDLAKSGALAETKTVRVRSVSGERFDRIIGYELGEVPDCKEPGWDDGPEDEPVHHESLIPQEDSIPF